MLQLKNITITHKKDLRELVKDFSFVLNPGDKAVIIGEEGNGKSTLLKLIYQEALIGEYAEYTGEIQRGGNCIGYLAQELDSSQKEKQVLAYFNDVPGFFDKTPKELGEIARLLGLRQDFFYEDRKVETLSGGEKVKLQLAGILMQQPDILLLDEPSNDLDAKTLEWLETFLQDCPLPLIYVSHDEMLIEKTANVVIHLEQIRRKTLARHTVARMGYQKYIEERLETFERQEQLAKKERSEYAKQMDRFMRVQQKVEHQQNIITRQDPHGGRLLKKKMHSVKSMERRFHRQFEQMKEFPETETAVFAKFSDEISIPRSKIVLDFTLEKLTVPMEGGNKENSGAEKQCISSSGKNEIGNVHAPKERILSENIHLCVQGPEKVVIIGKNGIGKTTLLRKIAKELLGRKDLNAAYMPQNYEELLDFTKTPVEFLQKDYSKEEYSRIRTYLGSMKYTADEMEHGIGELSGGQKAKLLFLKISMDQNDVLVLDEPTRNFSPLSNPVIRQLLKHFGGAIISISHDRKYIQQVCNKVYCLTEQGLALQD